MKVKKRSRLKESTKERERLYRIEYVKNNKEKIRNKYLDNKKRIISYVNNYNKTRDSGLFYKYLSIKRRCNNKSQDCYKWYGGRGITIEWKSYTDFKADMYDSYIEHLSIYGHKQTTLDRIDNDKNYSKENCRWATIKEQAKNRRPRIKNPRKQRIKIKYCLVCSSIVTQPYKRICSNECRKISKLNYNINSVLKNN